MDFPGESRCPLRRPTFPTRPTRPTRPLIWRAVRRYGAPGGEAPLSGCIAGSEGGGCPLAGSVGESAKEGRRHNGMLDPVRDPRFIATGRAAIAAKTCGKVDVLTSTPPGCRTFPFPSATPRGRGCMRRLIHGSSGLRPSTCGYEAGTPEGCTPASAPP